MELKIKLVHTQKEREDILKIRKSVFIDEQNIPIEIEIDAFEESANYIIAYMDEVPVGTARWREVDNDIKLEENIETKKIKLIGLYDPEDYDLEIDMWLDSDGDQIKTIFFLAAE